MNRDVTAIALSLVLGAGLGWLLRSQTSHETEEPNEPLSEAATPFPDESATDGDASENKFSALLNDPSKDRDEVLRTTIAHCRSTDIPTLYRLVSSNTQPDERLSLRVKLLKRFAAQDPKGAIEFLATLPHPLPEKSFLEIGRILTLSDADLAIQWAEQAEMERDDYKIAALNGVLPTISRNDCKRALEIVGRHPEFYVTNGWELHPFPEAFERALAREPVEISAAALELSEGEFRDYLFSEATSLRGLESVGIEVRIALGYGISSDEERSAYVGRVLSNLQKADDTDATRFAEAFGLEVEHARWIGSVDARAELRKIYRGSQSTAPQVTLAKLEQLAADPVASEYVQDHIPSDLVNRLIEEDDFEAAVRALSLGAQGDVAWLAQTDPDSLLSAIGNPSSSGSWKQAALDASAKHAPAETIALAIDTNDMPLAIKATTELAKSDVLAAAQTLHILSEQYAPDGDALQEAALEISTQLAQASTLADAWEWLGSMDGDPEFQNDAADRLSKEFSQLDTAALAEFIAGLPNGSTKSTATSNLVNGLRRADPSTAFAWALTLPEDQRDFHLLNTIRSWVPLDPDGAAQAIHAANLGSAARPLLQALQE